MGKGRGRRNERGGKGREREVGNGQERVQEGWKWKRRGAE